MSLDGSGSMSWNDPDEDRNAAAKQFVSRLGPTAQLAVASFPSSTFGEDYTLHQDFTSDKALLEAAIDEATFASGGTPRSEERRVGKERTSGSPRCSYAVSRKKETMRAGIIRY